MAFVMQDKARSKKERKTSKGKKRITRSCLNLVSLAKPSTRSTKVCFYRYFMNIFAYLFILPFLFRQLKIILLLENICLQHNYRA